MRETTVLVLPKSKATITLYTYLNISEYRELQRSILKGVTVNPNKPASESFGNISADVVYKQQNLALGFLVEKVQTGDGNTITNTKEFIDNLSIEDGELLYAKINEITRSSDLAPKAKKK